ncbi:Uncharacterized [Moorella glycerini]|uniref:Uncharacterized protein n=1 Tax=Neomoorella stamsii TaxID=1266720 RepID=A0A9X7J2Q3_9FIRM|nr:hypothetical protein MOST_20870 [Moorella stamsii]CEP67385.1 Uncharacterized [Moorella glycerini]
MEPTTIESIKIAGWHLSEASELLPNGEAVLAKPQ